MTIAARLEAHGETKRMTLGELRAFLAAAAEVADDTPVKARVTVGGYLKSVEITGRR